MTFQWQRFMAVLTKEFIQMKRDRMTFAMMIGMPLIQLVLFGFAINTNPKHLPTAVLAADQSPITRSILKGFENTHYFTYTHIAKDDKEAEYWLKTGKVQFVITIPVGFTKQLIRGEKPAVLIEADATDPTATAQALAAANGLNPNALLSDLKGPIKQLVPTPSPVNFYVHAAYNPESRSQLNIVPGLIGVILTMTMVIITCLAITRERERGTMENLLSTPIQPLEIMSGKVVP